MLVNFSSICLVIICIEYAGADSPFNRVIDAIISKKTSQDNELDPIRVGDSGFEFKRRVAIIEVHGVAKFFNISLHGLSRFKRSKNVQTEKINDKKTMTIFLGVQNLTTEMVGILRFMGYGFKRNFTGIISDLELKMIMTLDPQTDLLKVSVFKIEEMSKLKLNAVGGFRVVDAVTNQVLSIATDTFHNVFRYAIELTLSRIADKMLVDSSAIKRVMATIE